MGSGSRGMEAMSHGCQLTTLGGVSAVAEHGGWADLAAVDDVPGGWQELDHGIVHVSQDVVGVYSATTCQKSPRC